jgi:hypothetical protein
LGFFGGCQAASRAFEQFKHNGMPPSQMTAGAKQSTHVYIRSFFPHSVLESKSQPIRAASSLENAQIEYTKIKKHVDAGMFFSHVFQRRSCYAVGTLLLSVVENLEKDIFQYALHAILRSYGDARQC